VEAEEHGAVLVLDTVVCGLERRAQGWTVAARSAPGEGAGKGVSQRVRCGAVVNAAGLHGDAVAALAGNDVDAVGYRLHRCKGDYFLLAASAPLSVSRLVYPIPDEAGLGIHATVDLAGRIRFGPDAEFVPEIRYDVDAGKAVQFAESAARYLPKLRAEWLSPDSAGVRPKLAAPGEGFADFVEREEAERSLPGLVNCLGIESPGLTAATAIARRVSALLG
jgi:L-2-hydroxyglutarate oxidase LhgO